MTVRLKKKKSKKKKKNKTGDDFVNLHVHTDHSVGICITSGEEYLAKAAELGQRAIAFTNYASLSGIVDYTKTAKKHGVRVIVGCDFWVLKDGEDPKLKDPSTVTLLVKNETGWKNLLKIQHHSVRDGFYMKPITTHKVILEHSEGLVCLAGGYNDAFGTLVFSKQLSSSKRLLRRYQSRFTDSIFVELQITDDPEQSVVNDQMLTLAIDLDIPITFSGDVHYLDNDHRAASHLHMVAQGRNFKNKRGSTFKKTEQFGFKDPLRNRLSNRAGDLSLRSGHMISRQAIMMHPDWPEDVIENGIHNASVIADICKFEIKLGQYNFPKVAGDADQLLKDRCRAGLIKRMKQGRIPRDQVSKYSKQILHELDTIKQMGIADFFLLTSDILAHVKNEMGVFVGGGRGSAAGSLVCYVTEITELDPIRFNLLFERFLNVSRTDPPDIDVDIEDVRKDDVARWIVDTYGDHRVAKVITFGTYGIKSALRDMARIGRIPEDKANKLAKLIEDGKENYSVIEKLSAQHSWVSEFINDYPSSFRAIRIMHGKVHHYSVHAAGMVIAPDEGLVAHAPIMKVRGEIVCALQEGTKVRELNDIGLLKVDSLGLTNCSVIRKCIENVKESTGIDLGERIWDFDLDDPRLLESFRSGDTMGIFQWESQGIRKFTVDVCPDGFEDIIAINATYRPGTLKSGEAARFIKRKKKGGTQSYPDPDMAPILDVTYGTMVYQEQIMAVMQAVSGFTAVEAEKGRKVLKMSAKQMGKISPEVKTFLDKMDAGAKKKGIMSSQQVRELISTMEAFASYSFNRAHSASYALLAMQCMYLRTYYPLEFYSALLSQVPNKDVRTKHGPRNKFQECLADIRGKGYKILPPDINESDAGFRVSNDGTGIRAGLTFVKGIANSAGIISSGHPYSSLHDFFRLNRDWRRMNKRVIEALILAGAFDSMWPNRKQMLEIYTRWNMKKDKRKKTEEEMDKLLSLAMDETKKKDEPDFTLKEKMDHQLRLFGFHLTHSPLEIYSEEIKKFNYDDPQDILSSGKGRAIGVVTKVDKATTKQGKPFMKLTVNIGSTTMSGIMIWSEQIKRFGRHLVEGNCIAIYVKRNDKYNNWQLMSSVGQKTIRLVSSGAEQTQ